MAFSSQIFRDSEGGIHHYMYSKAWCLRNRLIEIRLAVLSSISHAILEIRAGC